MAAKDLFHDAVKNALIKEGWTITHDPLRLEVEGLKVVIDIGAENLLAAEKEGQFIAIEIKSFLSPSPLTDYHAALGQFLNYRLVLEMKEPDRFLYLAVPLDTYEEFFQEYLIKESVRINQVRIIVYDSVEEVIVSWIK